MDKRKNYFYPTYAPSGLQIKGLLIYEWVLLVFVVVLFMLIFSTAGLLVGILIAVALWLLCFRGEGKRMNTFNQLACFLAYCTTQQIYIKKERDETLMNQESEELQDKLESGEKKKKNKSKKQKKPKKQKKSDKKAKQKNMQDLFPFKKISDSLIEMEDGRMFIFYKVNANHLNFLSYSEIDALMTELGKQFDKSPLLPNFFIQDSSFDIKGNLRCIQKASDACSNKFLKSLAMDDCELIRSNKKEAIKKSAYVFACVTKKDLKTKTITELMAKFKSTFKNNLNVTEVSSFELKQMLAIYANRIFSDDLPDTELEEEVVVEKKLIRKKNKTYESKQLPGIYEFKDMIVPITAKFRPSDATIGSNLVKTLAVSSFIAATDTTNLLSKISSLKNVTTTIRMEKLPMYIYKNREKTRMKSKNAAEADEIDQIDNNIDKETAMSSYARVKKTKQNMYYISILFQLTANTKDELSILEDQVKEKCADVGIQVDHLQTMQRMGYDTVNPIGKNLLSKWVKQNIPTESVANLYPFDDSSLLDPEGLPIGNIVDKDDIVLFNSFTDRGTNHNILILGMSGMGKTILMMLLLQNEAILGSYIRNIDIEGTYVKFVERIGGININMAGNSEYCINPLHIRIPDEINSGIVDDYVSEVRNFMSIYKSNWSERLLDLFEDFTSRAYIKKGINNMTDLTKLKAEDMPLFSDIYELIEYDRDHYDEKMLSTPKDLNDLLLGMKSMVKGADAKIFNRYTNLGNNEEEAAIINFDLSDMRNSSLSRRLAQWSNIFTYIAQFVNKNMDRSKKIVVAVDELQHFFKEQYVAIMDIIESYERRFRKYLASFIKASQTIEEFNSENQVLKTSIKTLFSQPAIKFLYHLGDIDYTVTKDLLNLKVTEIETLKEKRNGKCLMRVNDSVYDLSVLMPEWFSEVKPDVKKDI